MFDLDEEVYEPDEIFMDEDAFDEDWQDEDLPELSFEREREASEGMSLLLADVESPEALFA
jgi:hypothetical protein